MRPISLLIALVFLLIMNSCVSKRFYFAQKSSWETQDASRQRLLNRLTSDLRVTRDTLMGLRLKNNEAAIQYENLIHELTQSGDSLLQMNTSLMVHHKESKTLIEALQKDYNARQNELQVAYAQQAVLESIVETQNNLWQELEKPIRDAFTDLGNNSVQLTREGSRLKLSIHDKILFNSGSANVNKQAKEALLTLANALSDKTNINLMVEGHTDNVPLTNQTFQDNWELSTARARSVNLILSTKIDPQRLTIAGKGEFDPVAPNTSEEERAKNRRTEIFFDLENSELEELISEMAVDIQSTRAKVITVPPNQEKYIIDERSWIRYELSNPHDENKVLLIRNLVRLNGKPWKVNTGNNYFQAKVRNYRVVVVKDNTPIIQTFDLVQDESRNILTIETNSNQ